MKIREARKEDIPAVAELDTEMAKVDNSFFELHEVPNKQEAEEYISEKFKTAKILVAEENKEIVGYIIGEVKKNEDLSVKTGYIHGCYIKPKYRKKGIGNELAAALLSWFGSQGISHVIASFYEGNKIAKEFWKKVGFKSHQREIIVKL